VKADSFKKHLTESIIPFWNNCVDEEYGGFCGFVGHDMKKNRKSDKGVILHSRILWFYSTAYVLLKDKVLLSKADHAYNFLKEYCMDSENGGMFWSVTYDGQPSDDTKHTYNQAFAIYALSAYYEASNKEEALKIAYELYHLIEEKCRDKDGYLEAFDRTFHPASNEKLSENGVMATRTMNTLLHVMEAYTELYRVDANVKVKETLCEILDIFCSKIYNAEKGICEVFFDKDYNTLIDLESYGHDIEAAWLVDRAGEVLNDAAWEDRLRPVVEGLSRVAYEHAFDAEYGCFYNEREVDKIDKQRIWWVQAEAVVGFCNAWQREPEKETYLQAVEAIWNYILTKQVDARSGEWFESVKEDGSIDVNQGLVHAWKCPYHNGRMCIEMVRRLTEEQHKKEPDYVVTANPNATKEAKDVLAYLKNVAGKGIVTGQHTQTNPMEEITYIKEKTGKEPKLRGFELLAYSPNINYDDASEECLTEIYENQKTLDRAFEWAQNVGSVSVDKTGRLGEKGGIVEFTFHWFSPLGGRDKSFYAKHTDFDASKILQEGTSERDAFYKDMDVIAKELLRFKEAGIPVLWRPFHEADGAWFWWGAKGPRVARQLYRLMFDYYTVEYKLDNLIWVWSCCAKEGYPGDARVDIISADIYLPEYAGTDYASEYEKLVSSTSCKKVAALAEVGYMPDIQKLQNTHIPWSYYMTWSKEFCMGEQYNSTAKLMEMYTSEYTITL